MEVKFSIYLNRRVFVMLEYSYSLTPYRTCPKLETNPFHYQLMCVIIVV